MKAKLDPFAVRRIPPLRRATQELVGIAGDRKIYAGMAFRELGWIDIDLYQFGIRSKFLPIEAGLLQPEARAECDDQVRLSQKNVGGTLAPRVRASDV
jgi:hypothetical protein